MAEKISVPLLQGARPGPIKAAPVTTYAALHAGTAQEAVRGACGHGIGVSHTKPLATKVAAKPA